MRRETIFADIDAERRRQDEKWSRAISSGRVSAEVAMVVLAEETGEVARAVHDGQPTDLRRELVQVAAVAVAMIEALDAGAWSLTDRRLESESPGGS